MYMNKEEVVCDLYCTKNQLTVKKNAGEYYELKYFGFLVNFSTLWKWLL